MRRCTLFVSVLLLVPFVFAQQSPRTVKNSTLSGLVLGSPNSAVVKRATVRLVPLGEITFEDDQHISAMTDDQGRFEFKEVPPGSYEVRVEHTGFVPARHSRQIVRLNPGQAIQDLALRLTPAAVITGHVLNEQGEPLASVSVQAMRYAYSATGRRLQGAGGANTDDQGEYRMFGLPPGRYYVRASFNMNAGEVAGSVAPGSGSTGPQMRYPPTYYPGVDSAEEASLVDIRPADQVSIDFNLVPERGVYVRGHLPADPQGGLGTFVMLLDEDGMQGQAVARNGAFEFPGILPGKYTLMAMQVRLDKHEPVRLTRTIQVGQTDLNNVDLEVSPTLSGAIHGRVRVAGDVRPELSQMIVMLQAIEARRPEFAFQSGDDTGKPFPGLAAVQKDGSFVMAMPDDGPGVYYTAVSARGPGLEDFYTKAVLYGDTDITESGLTLPTAAAPLEILIAADGATVQGRVTDAKDQPVDNATVVAIPANPKLRRWAELYQPVNTDQNGQFTIRGLRPGDYGVYAWQDIESYAFLDPDAMRAYENRGLPLKAEGKGRYAIVLHVLDEQSPEP